MKKLNKTRSKVALVLVAGIAVGGPAAASFAADGGAKIHGGAKTPYATKRIPGPAGPPVSPSTKEVNGKKSHGLRKQTNLSTKSCGVTAGDQDVANRIGGNVRGDRIQGADAEQIACARRVIEATKGHGLDRHAGYIALITAVAESTLHNYDGGDRDSRGLFQQRPSQGWGSPEQVTDPTYATNKFLSVMEDMHPGGSWHNGDPGGIAQSVQRSAVPDAYNKEGNAANVLLDAMWGGGGDNPPPPPAEGKPLSIWAGNVAVRQASNNGSGLVKTVGPMTANFTCQQQGEKVSADGYSNTLWSYSKELGGFVNNVFMKGEADYGLPICAGDAPKPPADEGKSLAIWATDVNVRADATSASGKVRTIQPSSATFTCQKRGENVSDSGYSNDLWSFSPQLGGYVNNVFMKGGSDYGLKAC
ncbi:hypothetical protein [Luteipulveratus mongoliensis]|uniref:hypothetical protein n=1 Tax=Luteipulveratus mongoliensis TaxID=571913 RepID=UPI000695DC7F|nr:hypothetical protein [Luteipulveratus mongoliensis]